MDELIDGRFLEPDGMMELRKLMRVRAPVPMPPNTSKAAGRKPMQAAWHVGMCFPTFAFSASFTSLRGLLMGGNGSAMLE